MMFLILLAAYITIANADHQFDHPLGNSTSLKVPSAFGATYSLECNKYEYFNVLFYFPCNDLVINVKPLQGQPDIYVSKANIDKDPFPTKEKLTWAAFEDSQYQLTINHRDPESSPGYYYIGIYNDCSHQSKTASFQIAISKGEPTESALNDLSLFPARGINQLVDAQGYKYYSFCSPRCSNVLVTLQNCLSDAECPGKYSYPELLVSRTKKTPTIFDHTYKLAQIQRRSIWVNVTDPSARDNNGFVQGEFYVGIQGFCTEDKNVNSFEFDGPCSYAARTLFNVTVEYHDVPGTGGFGQCPDDKPLAVIPTVPSYPLLLSGVPVTGKVACQSPLFNPQLEYTYYKIKVPQPCNSLNIQVRTANLNDTNLAELSIGKFPNTVPTFDNLQWTSYRFGFQNLTISAFDPAFDGGMVCGPDGVSECEYYVAVAGYCTQAGVAEVDFTLTATLQPLANELYEVPQLQQKITPNGVNKYQFCINTAIDVSAYLNSYTSACNCPNNYAELEFVISRTNADAGVNDLTFKLEAGNPTGIYTLKADDADTRPGTYYLNVIGSCEASVNVKCDGTNACTCAPCSHLANSPYSLYIGASSAFNTNGIAETTLGSCATAGVNNVIPIKSGEEGTCSGQCPAQKQSLVDRLKKLTEGATAGIAIAVIVVVLFILGVVLFCYRDYLRCCCFNPNALSKSQHANTKYSANARDERESEAQTGVVPSTAI